jgi:predicted Zn-dependent protease
MRSLAQRVLALLLALACASTLTACTINPATGKRILTFQTWDWERQTGLSVAPQMTQEYGGPVADSQAGAYVDEVGRKLLKGIEPGVPPLEWEFTLLDSSVINAFALPGGKVFFSRGLAERLSSEAEMAGVIGHEIGHVTARHANQRISQSLLIGAGVGAAAVVVGVADEDSTLRQYGTLAVPALAVGSQLFQLKYGRDEELEADMLGIRYMSRAGYNPIGQRRVMQTLKAASGGAAQPEWLSTHPASDTRIERIDELFRGEFAQTQNNPAYVLNEIQYRSRMLERLARLGSPAHGGQASLELGPAVLWCAHCQETQLAQAP